MAHIHLGNSTTNGDPIVNLLPTAAQPQEENASLGLPMLTPPLTGKKTNFAGNFTVADFITTFEGSTVEDMLEQLVGEDLYVNVHTVAEPAGLIRGQIVADKDIVVPPVSSPSPSPSSSPSPPSAGIRTAASAMAAVAVGAVAALF